MANARRSVIAVAAALLAACHPSPGAPPHPAEASPPCATARACEARAAARLEALRAQPEALRAFLHRLPKGADLHNHLSGSVYAESYLAWAREDGLALDASLAAVDPATCTAATCSALPASPDDPRFDAVLRAWSMKGFAPGGETGHRHFFSAFEKFRRISRAPQHKPKMIAEAIRRASDDRVLHLEIMESLSRPELDALVAEAGPLDRGDLPGFARKLRGDRRWPALIAAARDTLHDRDQAARAVLGCDAPAPPAPCAVSVRYLAQVSRTLAPELVFAHLLVGFDLAAASARVVGVNLVAPEDDEVARRDYDLHMTMLQALSGPLRAGSPARVALHAGELTAALAPAADLASHIRAAVLVAGADRIGHGVDVLGERDAPGLLALLRDRGVTVEICLTSNAYILEVSGRAHPLAAYVAAGVPVTLATDDAGVSRSSLTDELARAVTDQGVGYAQLKAMARAGVAAAFLPGPSLWADGPPRVAAPPRPVEPCAADLAPARAGPPRASPACAAFLATSERARVQWALERELAAFEAE